MPSTDREQMNVKPLQGIKIIDFGWVLVGPLTTKLLAAYGAEVIKLEGKKRADVCRTQGPFQPANIGLDQSYRFLWTNTGKKSVTINLGSPKGIETAKKFVAWADVVVENFAGGAMDRMGLGYDVLKRENPDIILLSTSMQGQTGPHAGHPGYGMQLTALSGFDSITGWPDSPPVELGFYTDFIAPHVNVLAILAALDYRERTGKGQHLDVSQFEAGAHFLAPLFMDYDVNKKVADRVGNTCEESAPHGIYRCRGDDRWVAIVVQNDEEWDRFAVIIGNPAWTNDSRFKSLPARKDHEEELNRLIDRWTIGDTAENIMTLLQKSGIAAGVVQDPRDLMENDPQLKSRGFFHKLSHPAVGSYTAMRPCFQLSKSIAEVSRAPLIGEHNEYAYKTILGLTDEEVAELIVEGVIE